MSNAHGLGWSSFIANTHHTHHAHLAHQICTDSNIIQMVSNSKLSNKKYPYKHINLIISNLLNINPSDNLIPDNFDNLIVQLVPIDKPFQIISNDGWESIQFV